MKRILLGLLALIFLTANVQAIDLIKNGRFIASPPILTDGTWNEESFDKYGNLYIRTPYSIGEVVLTAKSGNVANAAATATLTGTATTTVYIAGFEMTGAGATTGLAVTCTVTGVLGGTLSYTYVYAGGALLADTPLQVLFDPPLPASAVNTPIVASCPASGTGGTNATMVAHGYYQ